MGRYPINNERCCRPICWGCHWPPNNCRRSTLCANWHGQRSFMDFLIDADADPLAFLAKLVRIYQRWAREEIAPEIDVEPPTRNSSPKRHSNIECSEKQLRHQHNRRTYVRFFNGLTVYD